jgi:hypothetical protein
MEKQWLFFKNRKVLLNLGSWGKAKKGGGDHFPYLSSVNMFFMFAVQFVPGLMWHVPGDLSMPHFNYHCNFKLRTCGNREVDGQDTLCYPYGALPCIKAVVELYVAICVKHFTRHTFHQTLLQMGGCISCSRRSCSTVLYSCNST